MPGRPYLQGIELQVLARSVNLADGPAQPAPLVLVLDEQPVATQLRLAPEPNYRLIGAALRFVRHVEDFEEERADRTRLDFQATEQWWRCPCGQFVAVANRACSCRKPRGGAPVVRAEIQLLPGGEEIRLQRDDVVEISDGTALHRALRIERRVGENLILTFERRDPLPEKGDIRLSVSRSLFEAQRESLNEVADGYLPQLAKLTTSPESLDIPPELDAESKTGDMNPTQARLVGTISRMREGHLILVQGPPGTGKTTAIVEAIGALVASDKPTRVLFASHSNDAVDSGQQRLRDVPRVSQTRIADESRPSADVRDLVLAKGSDQAVFNVVAGTCNKLVVDPRLAGVTFDWLILDEANKVRVSEALPLMAKARRWVLVGDVKQLPPVLDDAAEDFAAKDDDAEANRSSSFYEWLWSRVPAACRTTFTEQYRMAYFIGATVSKLFYEGMLRQRAPERTVALKFPLDKAITWIDTRQAREQRGSSKSLSNVSELDVCTAVVKKTLHETPNASIAVIGMYAAQVDRLERRLRPLAPSLSISTVDGFEGREAEIVVLSLVRSNDRGKVGFLDDPQRVNVAISRAMERLVIVGDRKTVTAGSNLFAQLAAQVDTLAKLGKAGWVLPNQLKAAPRRQMPRRRHAERRPDQSRQAY